MAVRVQTADFDLGAEAAALATGAGAVVTFTGIVRGEDVEAMTLEHYPGMTEDALTGIEAEARRRWALTDALIIHRVGRLAPGEQIMMVGTASRHRAEAFAAAEFMMDYLKTGAPFWKMEETAAGARWVDARESDDDAVLRWRRTD
ncbi:molybdenum cofactor biosynthesis protein MoaE [Pikeienuella piscinae]|uniref:Molybdopterin synthase catalytic subunit n=1 Tax=Pikeienuella piscinae TaxID=2748098 RepID=A0A7M3T575_9RHOB|nr:molybdenum cofactor biosynthesis protein MoaE [Pikeienuella piscinae]QIE57156.1 molybdenum cofactor biosynthesis protein MoaE [Pikeienuella piscinae]